ncbi:UNVERIFIED_CONTAM: hypothetical protein HDU68_003012 [Siphonaria sp. JEL0065]|nr:hypothetical protein HDU68_003012 [Siphonaria sp. JEL0065]
MTSLCFDTTGVYNNAWFSAAKSQKDSCTQSAMDAMVPYQAACTAPGHFFPFDTHNGNYADTLSFQTFCYQQYNIVLSAPGLPILTPKQAPPPPPPLPTTNAAAVPVVAPSFGPESGVAIATNAGSTTTDTFSVKSLNPSPTTTITITNLTEPSISTIDVGTVVGIVVGLLAIASLILLFIKNYHVYESSDIRNKFYAQHQTPEIVVDEPAPSPIPSYLHGFSEKSSHMLNENRMDGVDVTSTGSMFDVYRQRPVSVARSSVRSDGVSGVQSVDVGTNEVVGGSSVVVQGTELAPPAYE